MKRLINLLAACTAAGAAAQSTGDILTFKKGANLGDVKTYTTPVNTSLYSLNGSGNFALLPQSTFQAALVSGTNLRTVQGVSLLGSGNIAIIADEINDGVTTAGPSQNAVFDALAGKAAASHTHAAADITSGVLATARLGTGTANSGTFLRGDGSWQSISTGVAWGGITGTLSNQTDLNNALAGKDPLTHSRAQHDDTPLTSHEFSVYDVLETQYERATGDQVMSWVKSEGDMVWSRLGHTHAAADITSGVLGTARLGTGTANSSTFLRGDGTWATPSTSVAWGGITGTLSNQTDLSTALNGKLQKDQNLADINDAMSALANLGGGGIGIGIFRQTPPAGPRWIRLNSNDTHTLQTASEVLTDIGGEAAIATGTTGQYWRGDKSWQTLNRSAVGLGNVENTALSTWAGSSNITTLGTIATGTVPVANVSGLGTAATVNTGSGASDVPTITQADARYEPKSTNVKVQNWTFNSATYTNLTGASVSLAANTTYQVRAVVTYTCPTSATGIGVSMTMTNSPTDRTFNRFQPVASTGTVATQIAADDAGAIATGSTGTTPLTVILDGNVQTAGSPSTLQLRVARGGTSATITILNATILAHPL